MPIRFQVELPYLSGADEDVAVNVWHTGASFTSVVDLEDASLALIDFYRTISDIYSGTLNRDMRLKVYDLSDAEPREPVADQTVADVLEDAGGPNLPTEVAVALSTHGLPLSGDPPARRRGRVYIGPLNTSVLSPDANGSPQVTLLVRQLLTNAGVNLQTAMIAAGYPLAIYSRTNDAYVQIRRFSCDDAVDIQRRRGTDPTTRTFADVP